MGGISERPGIKFVQILCLSGKLSSKNPSVYYLWTDYYGMKYDWRTRAVGHSVWLRRVWAERNRISSLEYLRKRMEVRSVCTPKYSARIRPCTESSTCAYWRYAGDCAWNMKFTMHHHRLSRYKVASMRKTGSRAVVKKESNPRLPCCAKSCSLF